MEANLRHYRVKIYVNEDTGNSTLKVVPLLASELTQC